MSGKDEMCRLCDEIKMMSQSGKCSEITMHTVAASVRGMMKAFIEPELSREEAANMLGVSTRTLSRMVDAGKIEAPRRHGHKEQSYSRASIEEYIEKKKA